VHSTLPVPLPKGRLRPSRRAHLPLVPCPRSSSPASKRVGQLSCVVPHAHAPHQVRALAFTLACTSTLARVHTSLSANVCALSHTRDCPRRHGDPRSQKCCKTVQQRVDEGQAAVARREGDARVVKTSAYVCTPANDCVCICLCTRMDGMGRMRLGCVSNSTGWRPAGGDRGLACLRARAGGGNGLVCDMPRHAGLAVVVAKLWRV